MGGLIGILVNGLINGSFYALIAVGVSLIFGLTAIVNFAQGQVLMLGAYVSYQAYQVGGYAAALIAGPVSMGVLGLIMYAGLFRFTLRQPISGFIISLGLIPVFDAVVNEIWGAEPLSIPPVSNGAWTVAGNVISVSRLLVLLISAVILAAVFVLIKFTSTGRALRACSEDRAMTSLLGVRVSSLYYLSFGIGSAIAGIGGAMVLTSIPITPNIGNNYIFTAFAVALIGGLGSISGAAAAGVALGVAVAFLTRYVATTWTDAYILVIMLLILFLAPNGLGRGAKGATI